MRAISIGALLLATPAAAQEPWYEYGEHEWGFRYWQGTFVGAGITLPHKLMINYPATTAGLDAPIATAEAPYPVIFFQHAGGSWYDNYDYLFSRLASRGFLVVSAQHDDDATWFCCGTYDEKHEDLFHATIDVVFQWNADPSEFLFGMVDADAIALAGHSHGSMATLLAMMDYGPLNPGAQYDIKAIHKLAPCPNFLPGGEMEKYPALYAGMAPLQVVYGAKDTDGCVAFGQAIAIYEPGDRTRHYAYVVGADHYAFTDAGSLGQSTITREEAQRAEGTAAIAWFELMLKGNQEAAPYLAGDLPLLDGAPEVTYQFHDPVHLVVDDFEDQTTVPGIGITGIPGQVFVNGFLSDAFVLASFNTAVELVREELRRIYPATPPPYEVLFYEDAIVGTASVYWHALTQEVSAGNLLPFTQITSSSVFFAQLQAGVGDVIVSAHQGAPGAQPHDAALQARVCAGDPAILTDWRNLPGDGSASSEPALQCASTGYDGKENWVTLTPAGDLFSGTLDLYNPGWGKSTVGLTTTATVFATTESGSAMGDPAVNALGLPVVASGLDLFVQADMLQPAKTLYHPTGGLEIAWSAPGASLTQTLAAPGSSFDASGGGVLSFRVTQLQPEAVLNPAGATKDFHVRLVDIGGNVAQLALSDAPQGPLRYPFPPSSVAGWKSVFETYRFQLAAFEQRNPALDLANLTSIELVFDLTTTGQLVFDDFELSPATAPLASATVRTACTWPAPPQSLLPAGDPPRVGETFSVVIDDPTGAAGLTPGSTITMFALSTAPAPGFPCGTILSGGGAGGPGELLLSIAGPNPFLVTSPVSWTPGAPLVHDVDIPADPS
ncbi:MAG: hypothetical protein O7B99_07405, partial [Planctomycetota bacterium]|nr:hypothetical protein [Planctomycetota bacterium]